MRVTFRRLPDHQRAYALVERDDGVRYRRYGGLAGPQLPHDIRHLIAERELGITDGIWAGIAAGATPPGPRPAPPGLRLAPPAAPGHPGPRSGPPAELRAELLADLVECVAGLDHPTAPQIRRLAGIRLAVLPGEALAVAVDPAVISAAASALQVEASRWARLRVGEALSYRWPPEPRRPSGGGGHAARLVRPDMPDMRDIGEQAGGAGCRDIRLCQWPASRQHGAMDARPDEIIETGEVILRRYREGDEAALVETVTTSLDHLGPWMPWAVGYSRAAAAEFLAGAAWDWAAGAAYNYAIITGGVLAGGISLMARIGPGGLEIGYWVHQGFTRRGLATTAAAALVQQAFALPGIDRVEIVHDELNVASGGVPRKLGFTEAGRRPIDPPPAAGTGMGVVWRLVR